MTDTNTGTHSEVVELQPGSDCTLSVPAPFNARTTLIKPSHFPSPFDQQGTREYHAVTFIGDRQVGLRASFDADETSVSLETFTPPGQPPVAHALDVLRRRLGLDLDLPGYDDLCARDEILSALPPAVLGARPSTPWSLYEYLTIGTVLQNTTISRTVQMAGALAERLGTRFRFPDGVTTTGFWRPAAVIGLGEQALREARLGNRAKTLVRVAAQFCDHPDIEGDSRALARDPSELRARLRGIYGVGPATSGYLMFDVFKSLDELVHLPPWEAKILGHLLFHDPQTDPAAIVDWCHQRWAPYTMLATHAVFEAVFWARTTGAGPAWLEELIRL